MARRGSCKRVQLVWKGEGGREAQEPALGSAAWPEEATSNVLALRLQLSPAPLHFTCKSDSAPNAAEREEKAFS